MWVYFISPPSLNLIGPVTTDIYYQRGITGNTDTHTHTHTNTHTHTETESDTLPI